MRPTIGGRAGAGEGRPMHQTLPGEAGSASGSGGVDTGIADSDVVESPCGEEEEVVCCFLDDFQQQGEFVFLLGSACCAHDLGGNSQGGVQRAFRVRLLVCFLHAARCRIWSGVA